MNVVQLLVVQMLMGQAVLASPELGPPFLASTASPVEETTAPGGSTPICDVPIFWSVGEVDPRFGLSPGAVEEAVDAAAELWNAGTGRELFRRFAEGVSPGAPPMTIHLSYDYSQQLAAARREGLEGFERIRVQLERWRSEIGIRRADLERERDTHQVQMESLSRQLASHNRLVEHWNQQGGAPPEEAERLAEISAGFEAERAALNEWAGELNREREALARESEALNEAVREYNRSAEEFVEGAGGEPLESGRYREEIRTLDDEVVEVERSIQVYHFLGFDHLVQVLAHEMGHALGLEHVDSSDAIMAETLDMARAGTGPPTLHPADRELLERICPR